MAGADEPGTFVMPDSVETIKNFQDCMLEGLSLKLKGLYWDSAMNFNMRKYSLNILWKMGAILKSSKIIQEEKTRKKRGVGLEFEVLVLKHI